MRELLIALQLARVIAGETPGCSLEAKLAVAWVADNRVRQSVVQQWDEGWYGNADPEHVDVVIALIWPALPDPTDGALYLIGPGDKTRMPWLANLAQSNRWECAGTHLEAYKEADDDHQH